MTPHDLVARIITDLTAFKLRGLLREAQATAAQLPEQGDIGAAVQAARERIPDERDATAHWEATSEWCPTHLDSRASQRLLDLQALLDKNATYLDKEHLSALAAAYFDAYLYLQVVIRARTIDILQRTGTAAFCMTVTRQTNRS